MDPPGSRAIVRDATIEDAAEIARIEFANFEGDTLSRRSLLQHLRSPTADVVVATSEGFAIGYALVFYRSNSKIARLYSIAVDAAARGKGAGRALMLAVEARALARRSDRLRLEVRIDNESAQRLYLSLGYRVFAHSPDYYEDGAEALRLEKMLVVAESRAA